ncbi:probable S-adenosylmethionine-dependent methyltransferase At5g37970 [Neltuma alba]|uniref:probable S-adenosylmethionine-dependent methyltransferase At5g37970 n=1 Tax=Neltuma alba TaxID=207710 RepID=UPI0010A5262D|nr:probable S-adenosylmethionine-dependent methyltransferase At5g37970 [Prosopis alba]
MENEFDSVFPKSYVMKGGEGPHSYAQNSTGQKSAIEAAKHHLQNAITKKFDLKAISASSENLICIADLGCSMGPNTFIAIQNIVEAIQLKYQSQNQSTPEILVFFNDQASNDFNTLFQNFPPNRNYFAAGIPGSFYGRLFPKQSLHLVHTSAALSWLSELPKELTDRSCGALNKGRIFYTNAPSEAYDAYQRQFKMDWEAFLQARAQELVDNGIMACLMNVINDIDFKVDLYLGKDFELLGSCPMDMAKLGLIQEEKVDTFNVPLCSLISSNLDLMKILETSEDFSIEQSEVMDNNCFVIPNIEYFVSRLRAVLEVLIENHFGVGIVDELFERFTEKVREFPKIMDVPKLKFHLFFVVLKRKVKA